MWPPVQVQWPCRNNAGFVFLLKNLTILILAEPILRLWLAVIIHILHIILL